MGLVLNYKVHGDGTIFNANQYPYPRHNLSENIVSAIFLDNRMRYYAISGDIWRFCPILRASAPFATPQIHGARIFSEPVDNEGTRRALSARAIANWTDEGDRSPENATFSRVLRSQLEELVHQETGTALSWRRCRRARGVHGTRAEVARTTDPSVFVLGVVSQARLRDAVLCSARVVL